MSTRESIARHRAEVTKTSPIAVIAKNITNNAGGMGRQAVVIAAASGLVLTSGMAANAAQPAAHVSDSNTASVKSSGVVDMPIKASTEAAVAASLVQPLDITSSPKPAPVVRQVAPAATKAAPLAQTVASKAAPTAAQVAPAAATPKVTASGVGATILAAAYAQLGVHQDCTALVSNSLAAAGIFYHGWPAGYMSLGRTVTAAEAQPGDLIYYDNAGAGMPHIAVYAGNGMAVHGGMNGGNTEVATAYLGSGPVFIAIGH